MKKPKKAAKKVATKTKQRGGKKSQEVVNAILAEHDAGVLPERISKFYNVSPRTILRYLEKRKHNTVSAKKSPEMPPLTPHGEEHYKKEIESLEKQLKETQKQLRIQIESLYPTNKGVEESLTNEEKVVMKEFKDSWMNQKIKEVHEKNQSDLEKLMYPSTEYSIPRFDGFIKFATPEDLRVRTSQFDPVNRPAHYADSKIEVIDFIEDKGFGYRLGNAVRLICKAQYESNDTISNRLQSLKRAAWYLQREIKNVENSNFKSI